MPKLECSQSPTIDLLAKGIGVDLSPVVVQFTVITTGFAVSAS